MENRTMSLDYTGKKYNKLTLLARVGGGGSGKGAVWMAQCDCGNTREVVGKEVAAGKLKSCGKCPKGLGIGSPETVAKGPRNASERRAIGRYVRKAFRERVEWALSYQDIRVIADKGCSLCGDSASVSTLRPYRLDDTRGYALDNCALVCPKCRDLIGGGKLADRLDIMFRIVDNLRTNK